MADLYDEMDIGDSGLNNNSSKASQKDSKIKNKVIRLDKIVEMSENL